jgi:hypothetical protein
MAFFVEAMQPELSGIVKVISIQLHRPYAYSFN